MAKTLRDDITSGLSHLRAEYGPTAWLELPGSNLDGLVVSRPEHVEHILETNQSNYRKPDVYLEQLRHLGEGLVTSRGDAWRDQHRLLMPMFQQDSVSDFHDVVIDQTETLLDRWRSVADGDGTIDLLAELERLTLHILGRVMFSTDMAEYADEVMAASDALRKRMRREQSPVPYPSWFLDRQFQGPVDTLQRIARQLIRHRRGNESEYTDLLAMMMTAEADGASMSDERIVDNVVTFLLAGHETTAVALTWTWYLLAQHPEIDRRLHDAVADTAVVTDHTLSLDELQYARQTIQEAMRVYPSVPLFSREALDDDTVGTCDVPSGTTVLLSQFLTHRDPTIWDDPLAYRPERFHPDRADERPRYSFYPFGGGARMCIGRQFALMEAQLVLALVAAEFSLDLESPRAAGDVGVSSAITMAPDTELEMSLHGWE